MVPHPALTYAEPFRDIAHIEQAPRLLKQGSYIIPVRGQTWHVAIHGDGMMAVKDREGRITVPAEVISLSDTPLAED